MSFGCSCPNCAVVGPLSVDIEGLIHQQCRRQIAALTVERDVLRIERDDWQATAETQQNAGLLAHVMAERDRLREALRRAEWQGIAFMPSDDVQLTTCPACSGVKGYGDHHEGCWLNAALAQPPEAARGDGEPQQGHAAGQQVV